jgi:hypothetical protein
LIAVNSKEYVSPLGRKHQENIHKLMDCCISSLNEDQLAQFFMLVLNNRTFWEKSIDSVKRVQEYFDKIGIDFGGLLTKVWGKIDKIFRSVVP